MATPGLSYCAAQVRRLDHDRYLTSLFAPAARREALFALYAFNLELARTREMVSEALLGRIRLQWWREALDGIFAGCPPKHEVAVALAAAVKGLGPSRGVLERLIAAREVDFAGAAPADLAALERYAEGTSATLVLGAVEILGDADPAAREVAVPIGTAYALTGLVRAVPFHARRRRLYLPHDLTARAGLDLDALFALRSSPALCTVAEAIARRAGEHLDVARARAGSVGRAALPALLPATLCRHALATLRRAGFDPFRAEVQAQDPRRIFRLAWAWLKGCY